jgi:hypothetical protein
MILRSIFYLSGGIFQSWVPACAGMTAERLFLRLLEFVDGLAEFYDNVSVL